MGISARLRDKIDKLGWSTRRFQQEVAATAPDTRGTSYASVYDHVEGKAKGGPPVEFLEVAAQVLNVRPAWLAFGEEPESAVGEGVAVEVVRAESAFISRATGRVAEELMLQIVDRLIQAQPTSSPKLSETELATVTKALWVHLTVTLFAFTKGGDSGPGTPIGQFYILTLTAMLAAVPEARMGRPLREVLEKLPQRGHRKNLEFTKTKGSRKTPKEGGR